MLYINIYKPPLAAFPPAKNIDTPMQAQRRKRFSYSYGPKYRL